ncbi:MAG: DNA-packaging protein [Lentisphaerae bacterium]|nr:DNA-packaging protein [Lentisphaerota bacterium]MCP4101263.1 DNA-packaging protein [Lentisphaerota bacterium]
MHFNKTADQIKALDLLGGQSKYVLLFGGSRSGKTFILVYAVIVRALKVKGSRHAVLRFRANAVRQSIWQDTFPKVMRLYFPGVRWEENRTDGLAILPNNSEIWFGGLDSAERVDKILGREFATIYFNECSEISYSAVATALTRLAQNTALSNKAYFDCNPSGKSHWSYKLFVKKIDPESRSVVKFPDNYISMLMNPTGNAANLPKGYIEETLSGLTERQRQRFLEGRWLDDMDGALWKCRQIDNTRVVNHPELQRIVVGVDPAVTSGNTADETGIVVAGKGIDGEYYVLSDASLQGTPLEWAKAVAAEFECHSADRVVAEVNNGGELIAANLQRVAPELPVKNVRAARGKIVRAEPIAALYEQGKVHHVGIFPELEDQICSFNPATVLESPDRMDALVWALTELSSGSGAPRAIFA